MLDFSGQPYYDDFDKNAKIKNYLRILYRPGYAVQARELTQSQSIIQNQIQSVSDFIFQNGSPVEGGHLTFDPNCKGLKISSQISADLTSFVGKLILNETGNVKAQVLASDDSTIDAANSVAGSLVIKYLTGDEFADADSFSISGFSDSYLVASANSNSPASVVSINDGTFYVDGFFVYVGPQTIVLDPLTQNPSYRVGLEISDAIVDENTDSSLLDPAQGSFNYQAPGATRYKMDVDLAKRFITSTDDSKFIELLRIENGIITNRVDYPLLGGLESTLARRTYDESGDYTVRPFKAILGEDTSNSSNYVVTIEPGKAYVKGYEFETTGAIKIVSPKARDTSSSIDYDLSLEYGNYLIVSNLHNGNTSSFNIGNFGTYDVHFVPSANINTSFSVASYNSTKIGSAKVRNIEYAGNNTYYVYILDANIGTLIYTAASLGANTIDIPLGNNFAALSTHVVNTAVTVISGNSSGDTRTIVTYNAATHHATVDVPFTELIDVNSQISFNLGIRDIESLVATPNTSNLGIGANLFATQNSSSGKYACMDISLSGKDESGTLLLDTGFNKLEYALPEYFITQNSFSDVTFYTRKYLTPLTFSSGNTTVQTGTGLDAHESFHFGFTNAWLPDYIANQNFVASVKNGTGSSNGTVIVFDHDTNPTYGNGVYQVSATQCVVSCNINSRSSFTGEIICTVKENSAEVYSRRQKTLYGNAINKTISVTDVPANAIAVTNAANVKLDSANGYCWFTYEPEINKTPGVKQSMYVPDVLDIVAIYSSGSSSIAPNTTNAIDVTSKFVLDNGQKDNYYDHASITLRDGVSPPVGQLVVKFRYYDHDATTGFFNADSYSSDAYANDLIPYYASGKFGTVQLRDVIDFRPTRTKGTAAFVLGGLKVPDVMNPMTLSYEFYLPRIDKLVLTKDKQFKMLRGTSAIYPTEPADTQDSMTLYKFSVPAYTIHAANIGLKYVENKRYTMRDIGDLDARLQRVEYSIALSDLESGMTKQTILYQDGATAKETYGILTDSFDDFSVADVTDTDLLCKIDTDGLKPYQDISTLEFSLSSVSGPYSVNDRTYSIGFTETPAIVQNTATESLSINPYTFGTFAGSVVLKPQGDFWYSTQIPPIVMSGEEYPTTGTDLASPNPLPPTVTATGNVIPQTTVAPVPPAIGPNRLYYRVPSDGPVNTSYVTLPSGQVVNGTDLSVVNGVVKELSVPISKTLDGFGTLSMENWAVVSNQI